MSEFIDLVNQLKGLSPKESKNWAMRQALHSPPPVMDVPAPLPQSRPAVTGQVTPAPVAADFGSLVNQPAPQGMQAGVAAPAPAYMAPAPGMTPEQQRLLAEQAARTPVPKMPLATPGALAHFTPAQTTAAVMPQRATVQPRASLAQLLGK